jgi:hypothetical protein
MRLVTRRHNEQAERGFITGHWAFGAVASRWAEGRSAGQRLVFMGSGRGLGEIFGVAPQGRVTTRSPVTGGPRRSGWAMRCHRLAAWASGTVAGRSGGRTPPPAAAPVRAEARTPRAPSRPRRRPRGAAVLVSLGRERLSRWRGDHSSRIRTCRHLDQTDATTTTVGHARRFRPADCPLQSSGLPRSR